MKSIQPVYYLALILAIAFFAACEDFLEEDLKGQRSDRQFFQTASDAELALTGIYNVLSFSNADNRIWVFGDVASDDAAKGGIPGDQADIGLIDNFNVNADNGNLETVWAIYFEGVARANKLLDNINAIEMDAERKNQIIGEAKFLRAYFYYWLVNIFGDIPVHTTTPSPEELQKPATDVESVYADVIIPDLQDAIDVLPENFTGPNQGRASGMAAYAFLARVHIFREQWQMAEQAAREVVNSGIFDLANVYRNNFNVETKDNNEVIFAVRHMGLLDPMLGNRLNQWFAPRANNGYAFDVPTQDFVDAFEQTAEGVYDPRLDYTVGREGQEWINEGEMFNPDWSPTGYLQKKYLQPLSEVPVQLKAEGELHYIFIRYADVLLMLSEALNEQGNSGEAVQYLNQVRERARESYLHDPELPGFGSIPEGLLPDIEPGDQASVRAAIRHERRVELGFEFHRYFDIMRYGQEYANEAFDDKENFNYQQHRYFPIPQSEMDTNKEL